MPSEMKISIDVCTGYVFVKSAEIETDLVLYIYNTRFVHDGDILSYVFKYISPKYCWISCKL